MQDAPSPSPDAAVRSESRLAAVRATGLLDTPAEPAFDRLTRLAVRLLRVPASFLSLVDEERDFYKAATGFGEPLAEARELQGRTFCHYSIAGATPQRPLVIPDTRADTVYRRVPTVDSLGVAAYLGVPIMVEGEAVGSMCAIDLVPRSWTDEEVEILTELAASAQREITLRMALDAARRRGEELRRAYQEREELLGATSDGVYTLGPDGRMSYANRAAAELLGYAPEEMVGKDAHALFHYARPDGSPYPREECPIARAGDEGRAVRVYADVLWRKDGMPLHVAYASSPLHRDGRVVGAVVRFTDVGEQKRAAEGMALLAESGRALSSSLEVEETLRAVARMAVPQLAEMAMVDLLEGDCIRRVAASHADERASALFERASRYPPRLGDGGPQDEVLRTGKSLLVREIDRAWIDRLERAAEHTEVVHALAPRSLVVAPLRSRGAVLGTLSFVRGEGRPPFDEADCDLAEELGRRAALAVENARLYDAARSATRARDEMLGVVSHDLRNPIHTVHMSASFLLDVLPEERKLERTQAAIIRRAAERANRLIQDLLDISHIESGRLSLDREPHEAASIAREAVEQAEMVAAERGIGLACGEMEPGVRVVVDRDRLLQALGNLIGNALKFTPRGGRVTVAARRADDGVRLSVADTGPGIPAAQVPRLFDRYWQANTADRRGVGLGLSIVKGIAEAHGGDVKVETEEGAGTTFTLVFPPES
ncbi:MAG: GAF domain-containing protein [Longimicrobiaceae bacterium]